MGLSAQAVNELLSVHHQLDEELSVQLSPQSPSSVELDSYQMELLSSSPSSSSSSHQGMASQSISALDVGSAVTVTSGAQAEVVVLA